PALFLIFINDISNFSSNNVDIKLFADDVKVFREITDDSSGRIIQSCLDNISRWSNDWQLSLSPTKCAILSIGYKGFSFHYKLNDIAIQCVNSFRDLGITIDEFLSFDSHISMICSTSSQRAALICVDSKMTW